MLDKIVYINNSAGISPSMATINGEENGEPDYKEFIQVPDFAANEQDN